MRKGPPPNSSPTVLAMSQLWRASNAWLRVVRRALEPLDLTHVQYILLATLQSRFDPDEIVTQRRLCRTALIDENMASQVIRTLVEKGLVRREPHPTDGRAQRLVVTPRGHEVANAGRAAVLPASESFFARLGDRLPELTGMLEELAAEDGP